MSYEIIRDIKTCDGKIEMLAACNNIRPMTFSWCEFGRRLENFEDKVQAVFEDALDGTIQLRSTCGRWYKLYKEIEEMNHQIFSKIRNLPDLDHMYKSNFYGRRREWLGKYATDRYFKRETADFEVFTKAHLASYKASIVQKQNEYVDKDQVAISSASYSSLFENLKYDVLADFSGNIYLAKKEQYANLGLLTEASKAIKFERTGLSMLFGVLSGNYCGRTREEILSWARTPLEKAAKDVQMDVIQNLLNSVDLPPYVELPWADFEAKVV